MSNSFFNVSGNPATSSSGSSSLIRTEFSSIASGFDKMPTLAANGDKIVYVNAAGTALEARAVPTWNQNTSGYASALKSATTTVSVSAATAPSNGQVLTASDSTTAAWVTPGSGAVGGTPNLTLGTSNSAGSSADFIKTDATIIAFDATVPSTQAFGDSAAAGSATVAARRDHKHAMPAQPAGGDATNNIGYLNIPQNSHNAGYTLVLSDAGKHIYMASAGTFTIPANASVAYPIGTAITFVNLSASSTIPITSDTMYLAGDGTTGTRTLAQYGMATALKVSSTSWIISGSGLT